MTVHLTGTLTCRDMDEAQIVRDALPEHLRMTRAEPGCLSFDVTARADDPLVFEVYETFTDPAAFEAHQQRVRASDWFRLTASMCRDYKTRGLPG